MSIAFACTCGKRFRAGLGAAGKRIRCPQCNSIVTVPQPEEHEPEASVEETPEPEAPAPRPRPAPRPAPVASQARAGALERYKNMLPEKSGTSLKERAYWLLLLAFIPLGVSLLQGKEHSFDERLDQTLDKSPPATQDKFARKVMDAEKGNVTLDDLIAVFPDQRLLGAALPRKTWWHWLYGLLAVAGFLIATFVLFPLEDVRPLHLLFLGLFTGTIGLLLLLLIQLIATWTYGRILISRNPIILIVYYLAFAIGFSYRSALDPDTNFIVSLLGFTFGVGLCEEACKALPLIWRYRASGDLSWRAATAWGFACGAGFGVAEGIIYSAEFYNGIESGGIYVVRFVSCVALHGIWTASVALFIHQHRELVQADWAWHDFIVRTLVVVSVPMILHGFYDTLLKKDLNLLALIAALASFGWFAWSLERARQSEEAAPATA